MTPDKRDRRAAGGPAGPARPRVPTRAERRAAARAAALQADPYALPDCRSCTRSELDCCDPHERN